MLSLVKIYILYIYEFKGIVCRFMKLVLLGTPSVVECEEFSRGTRNTEPLMLACRPSSPLSAPDFRNVYFPKLCLGGNFF